MMNIVKSGDVWAYASKGLNGAFKESTIFYVYAFKLGNLIEGCQNKKHALFRCARSENLRADFRAYHPVADISILQSLNEFGQINITMFCFKILKLLE